MSASIRFLTHRPEREIIVTALNDAKKLAQIARKPAVLVKRDDHYVAILNSHVCDGDVILETCMPITDNSLMAQYEETIGIWP